MDNISNLSTLCQCLRLLDIGQYRSDLDDHRAKQLFVGSTIQLHVVGQLLNLRSYKQIAEQLHAHKTLRKLTKLESISASALSRKTPKLCTSSLQALFVGLVKQIQALQQGKSPMALGKLCLVDATELKLPLHLAGWAYCSSSKQGVKMHTRVVVDRSPTVFPDRIIASTADVNETEVAVELVTDPDAIHVMDRGYQKHEHFEKWTEQNLLFVCRIRESTRWIVRRDYRISKADKSFITFDQKVILNKCKVPVRLVVFEDEHGRCYHVVTNCWNRSAVEIAQIYKQRWLIELFFKWMKQHLRLIQVFSYSPEGIWNQMYLALIAFALCRLIHLRTQTSKTVWDVLQWIRIYAHAQWKVFQEALHRKPTRTSRGRQVVDRPPKEEQVLKKIIVM